jgi:hypothetical protein
MHWGADMSGTGLWWLIVQGSSRDTRIVDLIMNDKEHKMVDKVAYDSPFH